MSTARRHGLALPSPELLCLASCGFRLRGVQNYAFDSIYVAMPAELRPGQ